MAVGLCKMERSGIHKANDAFDRPSEFSLLCIYSALRTLQHLVRMRFHASVIAAGWGGLLRGGAGLGVGKGAVGSVSFTSPDQSSLERGCQVITVTVQIALFSHGVFTLAPDI